MNLCSLDSVLRAGGLRPETIIAGSLQRCKADGNKGSKRSGAYRLFEGEIQTCLWWNWKTSDKGVWVSSERSLTPVERGRHRQLVEQARREYLAAQQAEWVSNSKFLARLWDSAEAMTEYCPAGIYLERRGLAVPNTNALRFMPRLGYWHEGTLTGQFPAMLAAVTSPDGGLINVHRTYLTDDGRKAPVPTAKKLCKSTGPMAGASIKIGQPVPRADGRLGLGVAEGVETAIAAMIMSGMPVWSSVSAHGLASFEPPKNVKHLYIFADNDESQTGQKAAAQLGSRAARAGLTARVLTPAAVGDWNDELLAWRAVV